MLRGENTELWNVRTGMYSNHCALNCNIITHTDVLPSRLPVVDVWLQSFPSPHRCRTFPGAEFVNEWAAVAFVLVWGREEVLGEWGNWKWQSSKMRKGCIHPLRTENKVFPKFCSDAFHIISRIFREPAIFFFSMYCQSKITLMFSCILYATKVAIVTAVFTLINLLYK